MRLIKKGTELDFMGKRRMALVLSVVLVIISIASLTVRQLNFGLDFTGGTLIEVSYPDAPELTGVRDQLASAGFGDAVVQTFGGARDIVVRLPVDAQAPAAEETGETAADNGTENGVDSQQAELSTAVLDALEQGAGVELEIRRVEFVGPQIGSELAEKGGLAMLYVLIGIFIYILFRFQWRFSAGAVIALVHDVVITLGVVSLLQVEFDLTVVAALLAVIGYSLNDTIVVFDRIRENFPRLRNFTPVQVINRSINQMLARTVMTSVTTLLVLAALFYFGGDIIHAFAFTLIIGVLIGTYSSIFVASTSLLALGVSKQDLMPVEKEGVSSGAMP